MELPLSLSVAVGGLEMRAPVGLLIIGMLGFGARENLPTPAFQN
jgi:hypothetical protein